MKASRVIKFAIAASAFTASLGHAATVDFTSAAAWSAANNQTSYTSDIVTLTASGTNVLNQSVPSVLTFNGPACGNSGVGLACQGDGIGINRSNVLVDERDEINVTENLRVNFAAPVALVSIDFLNLVYNGIGALNELMQVRVNGGSWATLTPVSNQAGGYFSSPFSASNVTSLDIRGARLLSEGSLARIEYVPVPGSLALLGIGALGLTAARRRKAA